MEPGNTKGGVSEREEGGEEAEEGTGGRPPAVVLGLMIAVVLGLMTAVVLGLMTAVVLGLMTAVVPHQPHPVFSTPGSPSPPLPGYDPSHLAATHPQPLSKPQY